MREGEVKERPDFGLFLGAIGAAVAFAALKWDAAWLWFAGALFSWATLQSKRLHVPFKMALVAFVVAVTFGVATPRRPTIEEMISGLLNERTIVYVAPLGWDKQAGQWVFEVHALGNRNAATNVHVWAIDNAAGVSSVKRVVTGVTVNPFGLSASRIIDDSTPHFSYPTPGAPDVNLLFKIEDASGAHLEQILRVKRDTRPRHDGVLVASVVREPTSSPEVLLGCQDEEMDLSDLGPLPEFMTCDSFWFRGAHIAPERTRHWKRR